MNSDLNVTASQCCVIPSRAHRPHQLYCELMCLCARLLYTSGVAWTALALRGQLWRCVDSSGVAWAALVGVTVGVTVGITRWASRGGSLCRGSPQHFHGALCAWPCPWYTQGHRHTGSCPTAVSLGDGTVDRCWVGGTAMNQIWANVWRRSSPF